MFHSATPSIFCFVMPGFMSGIHAFFSYKSKTWMASEVGLARLPHKNAPGLQARRRRFAPFARP
jgi:hypothetical protein